MARGRSRYVRFSGVALALIALGVGTAPLAAQSQPPSEKLAITAKTASIWSEGSTQVIQLEGPLTIVLDRAQLSARQAVIWLTPVAGAAPNQQHAEIVLLGD